MARQAGSRRRRHRFENRHLLLEFDTGEVAFNVREKATGVLWRMAPSTDEDLVVDDAAGKRVGRALASSRDKAVEPARNGQNGLRIRLSDLGLVIQVILDGRRVAVDIERLNHTGPSKVRDLLWPRHFLLPKRSDACTTWTVGQGSIVPGNWKGRFHHPEGYSEQEMCWHGAQIGDCGVAAIAETPYDLYIAMCHRPKEAPSTFIHWLPSHSDLRYTRRVFFHFEKGLDYVGQAKLYREFAKQQGWWISLAEKARRNPNVNRLKGAAVVTSMTAMRDMRRVELTLNTFADQAKWAAALRKKTGLKNAVVHVDGWGKYGYDNTHPDNLPPNKQAGGAKGLRDFREKVRKLGWLFGLHDQYIDIYTEAPSYDEGRLMVKENGKPNLLSVWAGGKCSHLCFSEALKFLRRNFVDGVRDQYMYHNSPPIGEFCDPDAYYLDCFARIHECFNPAHPLTRSEVVWHTNECLRTVHEYGKGVVLSCEHPKFYTVPNLEFGWGVWHLNADVQVTSGGSSTDCVGVPVPLWHLVYHDATWLPLGRADAIYNFLYVQGPYYQNSKEGPSTAEIAVKREVCKLNEVAGFDEMTGFKLLTPDGNVAESSFSSGVRVRVDKKAKAYRVWGPKRVATDGMVKLDEFGS